ncbi:hypothetical protein H2203_003861 [Taxawa tesnikishii (nom. ined.)]|nr:hypothetical protein H2203_003861 [Dothideales sp. JES 119]
MNSPWSDSVDVRGKSDVDDFPDESDIDTFTASPASTTTSFDSVELEKGYAKAKYGFISEQTLSFQIAEKERIEHISNQHPLPEKNSPESKSRFLRLHFWSTYRVLFVIVFLANLAVLIALSVPKSLISTSLSSENTATAVSCNLLVAIAARNEHVVNMLFACAVHIPLNVPLRIRTYAAKVYGYGGMHSGCAIAAVSWYILYVGLLTRDNIQNGFKDLPTMVIGYSILALLLSIVILAYPSLRIRYHDVFENVHRFAGWSAIALFWAQIPVSAYLQSQQTKVAMGKILIQTPTFWILIAITLLIIYPWTNLRLRTVEAEVLSPHAMRLYFPHGHLLSAQGVRLTDAPLKETHSFATIPNPHGAKGFSVIISNAGDWTNRMIQNPPAKLWMRGLPTTGMLHVALAFRKCVIVTTGSGIGPCLSVFAGSPEYVSRILWSTPKPLETYGVGLVSEVMAADPEAVIIDTRLTGRPDLTKLAYSLYKETDAEAVLVMSNQKVVESVVGELEARGVPAFGPIFDS